MGSRFENLFMFMADVNDTWIYSSFATAEQDNKARVELAQKRVLLGWYAQGSVGRKIQVA